jgi:hypothetical protein
MKKMQASLQRRNVVASSWDVSHVFLPQRNNESPNYLMKIDFLQ